MVKQLQEGQRERPHEVMAANSNVLPAAATKASATQDSSEFAAFCRHSGLGVGMWRPCKSVLRNWSRSSRLVKNTSLMRAAPLNQTCGIDFAQDFEARRPGFKDFNNWAEKNGLEKPTVVPVANACPCDCWWTRSFAWPGGKCRHQSAVPSYKGSGMYGFPYFFNPIDIAHTFRQSCTAATAIANEAGRFMPEGNNPESWEIAPWSDRLCCAPTL